MAGHGVESEAFLGDKTNFTKHAVPVYLNTRLWHFVYPPHTPKMRILAQGFTILAIFFFQFFN